MALKVFVLGRPGSGKSTATRRILKLVQRKGWSAIRVNDYEILQSWYMQEKFQPSNQHKRFRSTAHNGFDVTDFSVLNTALEELEKRVWKYIYSAKNDFILIEFARDDYGKALSYFSNNFLQNAYFLLLDADIDTCIQRVHNRTVHPTTADDHFVSDDIIRLYYHKDNKPYMISNLKRDYLIDDKKLEIIDNTSSLQSFAENINKFVEGIFEREATSLQRLPVLHEISSSRKTGPSSVPSACVLMR